MSSKCIFCKQQVRPRQEGLQCDGCLRRQHCTCETGVSQSSYRSAVKTGSSIDWLCSTCDVPQAESTPILFSESDLPFDPEADSVAELAFDEFSIADPPAFELASDPDLDESSIADPPAAESPMHQSLAVTFEVINECTTKGKPKLIDSRGYSYGIKRRRANATDWVCTRRPKVIKYSLLVEFYWYINAKRKTRLKGH